MEINNIETNTTACNMQVSQKFRLRDNDYY